VRLGPDAAAFTGTYAIPHRTPAGTPHTLAGAWTFVFRRAGVRWVIVQEHLSDVPRATPGGRAPVAQAPAADARAP
jgi:ketosteroid isomerase-like protein